MKHIILTGFEPFGPYMYNPVEESTKYFDGKIVGNTNIIGIVVPCTYYGAFKVLKKAISDVNPDAIISTGLASSVKGIQFETTGRNIMNGKYPDADNYSPKNVPLLENGEEFIASHAQNHDLANILEKKNIPTHISADADSFICNSLLYLTSHYIQENNLDIKNTFIHVPWTDNYADKINLEPHKIMISRDTLYSSIELIAKNILK